MGYMNLSESMVTYNFTNLNQSHGQPVHLAIDKLHSVFGGFHPFHNKNPQKRRLKFSDFRFSWFQMLLGSFRLPKGPFTLSHSTFRELRLGRRPADGELSHPPKKGSKVGQGGNDKNHPKKHQKNVFYTTISRFFQVTSFGPIGVTF